MTTTISYTITSGACSGVPYIRVSSSLIDTYMGSLPSPDHTLLLTIKVNCETSYEVELDDSNITDNAGTYYYDILPADVSETDSISDGIYYLDLTKTVTASGSTTSEYSCNFVDCYTGCYIIDHIALDLDSPAGIYYYLLSEKLNVCGDCNCEGACSIYCKMQSLMDNPEIENACGCN